MTAQEIYEKWAAATTSVVRPKTWQHLSEADKDAWRALKGVVAEQALKLEDRICDLEENAGRYITCPACDHDFHVDEGW